MCRYLAVHNAVPDDALYPGYVRVIAHCEREKAAVWKFAEVDGAKYLEVAANPDETAGDTVGCYLAVPPDSDRDSFSAYLGVTSDVSAATPVAATPVTDTEYTLDTQDTYDTYDS